jgi:hypothetical protein
MQFLGFDHNYCPDAMSMNYTYSNWFNQLTEQGGFKVYRDGVEVYSGSASLPYTPTCVDMKFVNDGVGFMVLRTPLEHHRIYRTEDYGQTWQDVLSSNGAPYYAGMYVINDWTAYMVTYYFSAVQKRVLVARASTIPLNRDAQFINDDTCTINVYETDALLNADRCGADSLQFAFASNGDTITYHINFEVINASIQSLQPDDKSLVVYPNPAHSKFSLQVPQGIFIQNMRLVNLSGQEVANFDHQLQNGDFQIEALPPGLYVLLTRTQHGFYQNKLTIE